MPFVLCSDFTIFPDNLQLGPVFTLSGMDFQDNTGGPISIVNENNRVEWITIPRHRPFSRFPDSRSLGTSARRPVRLAIHHGRHRFKRKRNQLLQL